MYSEALRILDFNTVQYMIEEQQKEIEAKDSALAENKLALAKKDSALAKNKLALAKIQAEKNHEIEMLKLQLQRLQQK